MLHNRLHLDTETFAPGALLAFDFVITVGEALREAPTKLLAAHEAGPHMR
jgi:hypothetical protein